VEGGDGGRDFAVDERADAANPGVTLVGGLESHGRLQARKKFFVFGKKNCFGRTSADSAAVEKFS
jgi:hypothetical protein